MTRNKTIAITGANGFLGGELVRHFSEAGYTVRALVRQPEKHAASDNVSYSAYDITQPLTDGLLNNCDYLVHAAFIKQAPELDALALNVDGAKRLISAAQTAGVKRTVFISSMSAHSQATSAYGLQKLAIEKLFDAPNAVSLRSGLIIGNGGLVKQMADFMRTKHAVPLIGGGQQPLQTIAVYDLAQAVENALRSQVTGILTIATPRVYKYKDFYQALGHRLETKFVFIPLPYLLLQIIIRTITGLHIPLGVNEDNLIGLKNLRAAETTKDLKRLDMTLDNLEISLKTIVIS